MTKHTETALTYVTLTQADGAAFWVKLGPLATDAAAVKEIGSQIVNNERYTWVFALDGDEVVGCGAFVAPRKSGDPAWLDFGYVKPSHRWQGIWKELFDRRIALARSAEVTHLRVCTRVLARALEARGFATYQQRGSWSYMERDLTAAPTAKAA
ncbi:GNAT family N-acetyltransferase (plasmid) [Rhodovastum atsumiense]|uniref:GNAT family N-acetyltransferase n=1 Tax=Rhodovastum atsumiense TaxID=504468 RepID=A0A5M6IU65_9PROT|nr:GNAT family N-acetyltransferase [Rhodovastum atsumiense]KAA5611812.1 GNAT family N-acetyltransferase [Rhodovastum atsumiense]CAH2606079.1 GNAT family N-acetyltransferase [Rhodovastum atsumiense]